MLKYKTFQKRCIASLIDIIVVVPVAFIDLIGSLQINKSHRYNNNNIYKGSNKTFQKRCIASLIDIIVVVPVAFIDLKAPYKIFFICTQALYFIYLHGKYGQTLGKKITGVKVYDYH